jgi:hypothetical protein
LRISSGRSSVGERGEGVFMGRFFGDTLNGVGRKRACRTDWRAEVVDLVIIRRIGWRVTYLDK